MSETEVLIAGGGPVGLSLAIELGCRGVRCLLAEQKTAFSGNPKAKTVHNRTLELFRRWGLGVPDKLRAAAPLGPDFPSHIYYVTRLTGELVVALRAALTFEAQAELSPERALRIPQSFLEPVLRDEAERLPSVDLRFGWRLESFEQEGDGVRAALVEVSTGRCETVAARWLAGCDGGRSTVRRQLGIRTLGAHAVAESLGGVFRAPELWSAMRFEPAMHYNVLNDDLPAMVTMGPLQPPDVWFFDAAGLPPEVPPESLDPRALLRSVIGQDTPFEVLHAEPWTVHNALAERYRDGRVFLLGDAAHMQAPSGGFGMNGGVGDAVNFGWKLAAVLQGWAGSCLLDS